MVSIIWHLGDGRLTPGGVNDHNCNDSCLIFHWKVTWPAPQPNNYCKQSVGGGRGVFLDLRRTGAGLRARGAWFRWRFDFWSQIWGSCLRKNLNSKENRWQRGKDGVLFILWKRRRDWSRGFGGQLQRHHRNALDLRPQLSEVLFR